MTETTEKAESVKDETGGEGAIQGAVVVAETARIVMGMSAAEGNAPALALRRTSQRRRKRRRRRKTTEPIIQIPKSQSRTGFEPL